MSCAVVNCSNTLKRTGHCVSYHKFPTDEKLRKTWLAVCGHDVDLDSTNLSVCSAHFNESDFEQNLNPLDNSVKVCLKSDVCPHLNLLSIKIEPIDYDENERTASQHCATEICKKNKLVNPDLNYEETNDENETSTADDVRNLTAEIQIPTSHAVLSSTASHAPSSLPASQTWPGKYGFTVSFGPQEKTTKGVSWTYSEMKDKLYVGKDVPCPMNFSANTYLPEGVIIRATALYASPEQVSEVVHRCFNHSMEELKRGLVEAEHLVRCESPMAKYVVDSRTGRHSVIVPFENPPAGQQYSTYIYKFACFGSCSGGPNRRPLMLIFTLEKGNRVLGRKKLHVKICACPGRDRKTEESQRAEDNIILPTKRKEHPDLACLSDVIEFSKSVSLPPIKKVKSMPSKEGYTITVSDKECYDFLKQMKKFFGIYKMMKNLPTEVSSTLLHFQKRQDSEKHE